MFPSDLKLRVRILIDGTLIIFRVKPEDAGKYTCSPSNSLGISPSASAHLTVQCECCPGNRRRAGEGGGWGSREGRREGEREREGDGTLSSGRKGEERGAAVWSLLLAFSQHPPPSPRKRTAVTFPNLKVT